MENNDSSQQQLTEELTRLRHHVVQLQAECLALKQISQDGFHKREIKFHTLADVTTAAIFIYQDMQNRYINPAAEVITGYSRQELLSMNFWDIIHPDFREFIKNRGIARQRGESIPSHYEVKILTKNGEERWLDFSGALIEFQGRPAVLGTAFDITAHKLIEAEITQRNAELLALQYAGATIAASLDIQLVLNTFTQEMVNLLRVEGCAISEWDWAAETISLTAAYGLPGWWAEAELTKVYPLTNFPLIKRVLIERRAQQLTINQADPDPAELAYMHKIKIKTLLMLPMESQNHVVGLVEIMDGRVERVFKNEEIRLAQLLANQAASALENARLYQQAQQEIIERKKFEEELRQSEARHRALLDAIPDMMFRISREGQYLYLHGGKEWGLDQPAEKYIGKNLAEVLPAEIATLILAYIHKGLDLGAIQIFEYRLPLLLTFQDYEIRLVASSASEVLVLVRNITERKRMEEQAIQAERLAALGRLSAALTHEINNPLQSIRTHLDLMLDFSLEPGEDKKFLQIMRQEIDRLTDTTRRILNFARPQPASQQKVSVGKVLEEVLILASKQFQQHGIQVIKDWREVPLVLAAPGQLTQVFVNLIINAIEVIPNQGWLHVAVYPEGDQVAISFTNSGPVISPDILPHIFEPFFTTKPEGSGLGLWVSHSLVQQHGGSLVVQNLGSDQGVVFTVNLPAVPENEVEHDRSH